MKLTIYWSLVVYLGKAQDEEVYNKDSSSCIVLGPKSLRTEDFASSPQRSEQQGLTSHWNRRKFCQHMRKRSETMLCANLFGFSHCIDSDGKNETPAKSL
ncbi:hypothetical protein Y032_0010g1006 [Ancylostoma ceylanicum]|uniref:Uncharacterized protein n=1 Tax=Ancylostoma ceylanicum TaxID=53326 RepID=A0A016VEX8_9BILA|nr:hypothetical protein Y032_0010g1006 [Ancylostoma ceylanicum]